MGLLMVDRYMLKFIVTAILLMVSGIAHSARCCMNGAQRQTLSGSNTFTASAFVSATNAGQTIRIDGYNLSCQYHPHDTNKPPTYTDFWRTFGSVLTAAPSFSSYSTGLRIRGVDYLSPISQGILVVSIPNTNTAVNLQTYMFVQRAGSPGSPINIRAGDNLATIRLRQTNNYDSTSNTISLVLNAANNLVIEPSLCTINNNQPIVVDFNSVPLESLASNPMTSTVKRNVRLNYSCPSPGVTSPIRISFNGTPASFNSNVLSTSNNLGTGVIRAGALVRPNQSFLTNITNSTGGDDLTFSLVRNPGTPPVSGPFTASATLVMSLP